MPRRACSALVAALVACALTVVSTPLAPAYAARAKATQVSGWSGGGVVASLGEVRRVRVTVRSGRSTSPRSVVLQRRATGAGSWSTVSRARTTKRGVVTLKLPTVSAFQGVVRLHVPATRRARALTTPARSLMVQRAAAVPRTTALEAEVARLVNEARRTARSCGDDELAAAGALRIDDRLSLASRKHARDMGTQDYFSHTSADGRSPWDRSRAAGYDSPASENIAAGYATAAAVVQGWLESPGHCRNVMAPDVVDIGVGFAEVEGSTYRTYWVQLFGRG